MKVLVFGGNGEIGHMICKTLSKDFDIFGTIRKNKDFNSVNFFSEVLPESKCIYIDSIEDLKNVDKILKKIQPDVVLNCIGVVKHRDSCNANDLSTNVINSIFPHKLLKLCLNRNIRLIHLSTDCVFSGNKGNYIETDVPDPTDYYGQSKYDGEINASNALTLRTSFIGPALLYKTGFFEWIMSQKGMSVKGFSHAIYSGLTTPAFCRILKKVIQDCPDLSGIYHVSSDPISKFELINLINDKFKLNINVKVDETFFCDRSLNSDRFREETKISIPSWDEMIDELLQYNT
tara:strand:+ start:5072 stop:5941 length:870 start_codon:yes stop_codon:yes gene_type:complete